MDSSAAVRLTAFVSGEVQAVGFRWWVRSQALALGLRGSANNLADGRVEVVVEGPRQTCQVLLTLLGEQPSGSRRPGRVGAVAAQWAPERGLREGFAAG